MNATLDWSSSGTFYKGNTGFQGDTGRLAVPRQKALRRHYSRLWTVGLDERFAGVYGFASPS